MGQLMGLIADIKKIVRSTMIALHGLRHAYRSDKSFRMEVQWGVPIYVVFGWYFYPFTSAEFLFFVFSYCFILAMELTNTASETLTNHLHPSRHEEIGKSKDTFSAPVLIAFVFAVSVMLVLGWSRIF